jgi:type 1 glutamine amidotransferase
MAMKTAVAVLLLGLAVTAGGVHTDAQVKAGAIPIMLLDGESGGPYHNWRLTTPVIKKELDETGLFTVTVVTAPDSKTGDLSAFHPNFAKYQVVVSNYDAQDWPETLKSQFEEYVRGGGGLVVIHAADNAFPHWAAYNEMIGIGGWRGRDETAGPMWYFENGKLLKDTTTPGTAGHHGARLPFQVVTRAPENPIMKGLPPVWMHAADELYGTLRGPGKNMTVLATAHSDPKNKAPWDPKSVGTGHDEPMVMVLSYGKGRIFHTTMGHDVAALSCVGLITLLQRGTEWAATGRVTQKVPSDFPTAKTTSMRVDIEAMDPAFLNGASNPVRTDGQ